MRLDPKYFTLFLSVCAAVTVVAIFFGTIRYNSNQEELFRTNAGQTDLSGLWLTHVSHADSLQLSDYHGSPVVLGFWATWSGKSERVLIHLNELKSRYPELVVVAGAVRDSNDLVETYINEHTYPFTWVESTGVYSDLQVPGVPSLILLDRSGDLFDIQVGGDTEEMENRITELIGS